MTAIILFGTMIVLLIIGVPISVSLGAATWRLCCALTFLWLWCPSECLLPWIQYPLWRFPFLYWREIL